MTEARNNDCIHFKVCKYSGCSQRHCDDYLTSHSSAKSDAVLDKILYDGLRLLPARGYQGYEMLVSLTDVTEMLKSMQRAEREQG